MPRINPDILVWARQRAGLEPDAACRKIRLNAAFGLTAEQRLNELEAGNVEPSRSLLVRMAKAYHRPLVMFYMSGPPRVGNRGQDFRTLPETRDRSVDGLLDALIRDVQARQSMVRAALEEAEEVQAHSFIGSMTVDNGVAALVRAIKDQINLTTQDYYACESIDVAFSRLREMVESQGVFVILRGDLGNYRTALDVDVFRGFALSDEVAPFIVINDQDARSAWSFTLIHELTHLWLGQTGVSSARSDLAIERFCNDVASEFLLPNSEINHANFDFDLTFEEIREQIGEFARNRNVSSSMVSYKLYRLRRINRELWNQLRVSFRDLWVRQRERDRRQAQQNDGGPNFYVIRRHRIGHALIDATRRLLNAGVLTTTKAGFVLGVKPKQVQALF